MLVRITKEKKKKMKFEILREQYTKFRFGMGIVFPIISMINFIIISFTLLNLESVIKIEYYVPLVAISIVMSLLSVGQIFHKFQVETDQKLLFVKQKYMIKCFRLMLENQNSNNPETKKWIKELKSWE